MRKKLLITSVTAVVLLGQPTTSHALICDGPCTGAIISAMTSINTALVASEVALSFAVQEAYGGMAQGVSGSVSSQTKTIINALDAVTVKLSGEMRKLPALSAVYQQEMQNGEGAPLMLNACTYNVRSTTLAAGLQTQEVMDQVLIAESRVYDEQARHYPKSANPTTMAAVNIQQLSNDVAAQERQAMSAKTTVPVGEQLRFFDGSILTDDASMILSTEAMQESARIYRLLAVNPVPERIISQPASPAEIQYNSKVKVRNAQRDLVHHVMAHYTGLRMPTVPTTDWIKQTAAELGYDNLPDQVSNEFLMYLMANYRVKSKVWTGINAVDWINSVRDRTQIEAERQYIQAQRWETRKHINLLLAMITAAEVRQR